MNNKTNNIENILLEYFNNSNSNSNPLVIYGNNEALENCLNNIRKVIEESNKSVSYIDDLNDLLNNDLSEDVFIFESINKIESNEQAQYNFFHLFNKLYNNEKLMIVFSSKLPEDLLSFSERIITRLNWGTIVKI